MSASQRQSGSMGEELTNAALIGLIALFLLTLVLRATAGWAADAHYIDSLHSPM